MTTWIVGPVAWDSVVYLDRELVQGAFAQGTRFIERSGGTGANVARALCTASVETGFVGYLGNDSHAAQIRKELNESKIAHLEITELDGPTSHVQILVDPSGERMIVGLALDYLHVVNLQNVPLIAGDTVVFVLWRDHFLADLELAKAKGCLTVVGLDAVNDPRVTGVTVAIGSHNDVAKGFDAKAQLSRFQRIVITQGAKGAIEYSDDSEVSQPAFETTVVDATGAGDSFLAGYLTAMARGETDTKKRLELGARWAAKTVATEASVPPNFETI